MRVAILILALSINFIGCSMLPKKQPTEDVATMDALDEMMIEQPKPIAEGSLFLTGNNGWSPWRDDKAHRKGDIITINVSVDRSAEEKATTQLSRVSDISAGIEALYGLEENFPGIESDNPLNSTSPAQLIKSNSTSTFTGDGTTSRDGKITAQISAIVTHVYANGNMRIYGSQQTRVNHEKSTLTVSGIVRPSDITFGNVVESDRIANASIEVVGNGIINDKQKPGLLMRAFDKFWPF